ncbi:hypothetical protein [Okeania sp.]|uniref:hypothetical protein n=1 Tax=Okeania sp. TaxID=3100323 RepID=UPI002B4AD6E6|nr:hypothetical protein [Okeania sp.]MEB3341847.1 hypothetical protein [Okeania sp.]
MNGFGDFIISKSSEQLYLDTPVVVVVEAKNERIVSGLGQCIAEMVGAEIYNQQDGYFSYQLSEPLTSAKVKY